MKEIVIHSPFNGFRSRNFYRDNSDGVPIFVSVYPFINSVGEIRDVLPEEMSPTPYPEGATTNYWSDESGIKHFSIDFDS